MWVLLEWENKISIKVNGAGGLKEFLEYILKKGNLTCITPNVFIEIDTKDVGSNSNLTPTSTPSFLACNLYAKSIFDEEILANLCLETNPKTRLITGHLRLRSKTQGLAVAYGDKLNSLIQKMKWSSVDMYMYLIMCIWSCGWWLFYFNFNITWIIIK